MREFKLAPDVAAAQHRQRRERKHLVHGQRERHDRQAQSGDRRDHRLQDARPGRTRSAHAGLRQERHALCFTLQQSNMIGRLNPSTGDIKLVTMPTPRALPYGIKVNSQGILVGLLQRLEQAGEPRSGARWRSASTCCRIRRHVSGVSPLTSDDMVWYVNSSQGRIGRLNPKTGEVKEWPSPSGPRFASLRHRGRRTTSSGTTSRASGPTRSCASTRRPRSSRAGRSRPGVGIIRHMRKTPDGNLVIHQSSSNRIGLAIHRGKLNLRISGLEDLRISNPQILRF